jgi:hypothetical protein
MVSETSQPVSKITRRISKLPKTGGLDEIQK